MNEAQSNLTKPRVLRWLFLCLLAIILVDDIANRYELNQLRQTYWNLVTYHYTPHAWRDRMLQEHPELELINRGIHSNDGTNWVRNSFGTND